MSEDDEYPVICTGEYVRQMISFELGQAPRSLVHAWIGKDRPKSEVARLQITERIAVRFDRLQVRRSAPPEPPTDPSNRETK